MTEEKIDDLNQRMATIDVGARIEMILELCESCGFHNQSWQGRSVSALEHCTV